MAEKTDKILYDSKKNGRKFNQDELKFLEICNNVRTWSLGTVESVESQISDCKNSIWVVF